MKIYLSKLNINLVSLIYVLLLLTIFSSCENKNTNTDPENLTKLSINILGTEEIGEDNQVDKLAKVDIKENHSINKPHIEEFEGFDAIVSLKNDNYKTPGSNLVKNVQVKKGLASIKATSMDQGKQFRMLIYKTDGSLYANQLAFAGTALTIDVVKGETYRWVAYSYNEDESVVLPDISDPGNPAISTGEGYDVLYASDNITIANSGNTPLGIVFKHVLNRIGVELNTIGMFADLISARISFPGNYFSKGTLNLNDGTVSAEEPYSSSPTSSEFVQAPGYNYGDRNVAYFYTANTNIINPFQVNLDSLTILLDDFSYRTFSTTSSFNVAFGIPESSLGKSRTVKIDLIESPLTIAGIRWGRANLYYQGGHNPYRFHHTYAHKSQRNSYFAFKAHLPESFSLRNQNIDPCGLVYPEGVWRHATSSDFSILVPRARTFNSSAGLGYVEYAASGTASPYPSNNLRINFNGQGLAIDLLNLVGLNFGTTYGVSAHIWSNTEGSSVLISLGGWYYYGNSIASSVNLQLLNVSLLGGLNVIQTPFKNIRCVRN